ncbi:LysR family transcriptional regulator [Cohnella faecalis]|uniref:LysR family transcriptional regulator n=1 Tax=Cohnella faecalis TaxID=2315694 RepID=UPI001F1BD381|nr:LysR family transcriptional regulator [Cohnella faecalis]
MKSFIEVARCNSFTKAAESLGYVQSSVTSHIQKLETEYGVLLFERYGRTVRLTSAGEQLKETFERILQLYDDSLAVISRQVKGHLDIGTIESLMAFFLPQVFHRFRQTYPQVCLQALPLSETQILHQVKSGDLDLGIVLDRPIKDDDVEAIILREEPLVLVSAPDHPLCGAHHLEVSQLVGQSYVATENGCTYRAAFEGLLGRHGVSYHIHHEFGSLEAIKQCVSYGLGIGLLPRIALERELAEGRLVSLPFRHAEMTVYSQVIHHKKKWFDPAIRHLVDLLKETARSAA